MIVGGRCKRQFVGGVQALAGDRPVQWVASLIQGAGLALCAADALAGSSWPPWVNLLGFAGVLGGFLLGAGVESDRPYLGPLLLTILPVVLLMLLVVVVVLWADDVGRRLQGRSRRGDDG